MKPIFLESIGAAQPYIHLTSLRLEGTRRDLLRLAMIEQQSEQKRLAGDVLVRPLNNPDPFRSSLGLTEKGSKDKAGGLRRFPLLLFELGIVPVVDL